MPPLKALSAREVPRPWSTVEPLEARIAPANLAYAFGLGGSKNESIQDLGVDAAGNVYISGTFQGTVDFDPGPGATNRTAAPGLAVGFVAKYTSAGAFSWVDTFTPETGSSSDIHIAVTPSGDVFVGADSATVQTVREPNGGIVATSPFHNGPLSHLYVTKIASSGIVQWARAVGTANPVAVTEADIATDNQGGVYITGTFAALGVNSSISIDGTVLSGRAGDANLYVLKLRDLGNNSQVVWANQTTSSDVLPARIDDVFIAVDASGAAGLAGSFRNELTFSTNPSATTVRNPDDGIFVARLDVAGAWTVAGQFGSTGLGRAVTGVAMDAQSALLVGGEFAVATDFDIGPGNFTLNPGLDQNGFLVRLTPGGALSFARNYVGPSGFAVQSGGVTVDSAGSSYVSFESDHPVVQKFDNVGNVFETIEFPAANGHEGFTALAADAAGGLYFAGEFTGSADLDPGFGQTKLKSKGLTDGFLAHYFPGLLVGQPLPAPFVTQAFHLGGTGDDLGRQILTDAAGNIFVTGLFKGTVDFDPGPGVTPLTSAGDADFNLFVAKYSPAGALTWARSVEMGFSGGEGTQPAVAFALDDAGNVYLTGEYHGQAVFGGITLTNSDPPGGSKIFDLFVSKLNSSGTFLWAKNLGSAGSQEFLSSLEVRGATGQVVLAGAFSTNVDFDPGAGTANRSPVNGAGTFDRFILSLDTLGNFQWVRQLGGVNSFTTVNDLAFTANGDVVATGALAGTIDFNIGGSSDNLSGTNLFEDGFVARFSGAAGSTVWRQAFGGTRYDQGSAIAVGPGDTIYVGGYFSGSVDFDPGPGVARLVEAGAGSGSLGPFRDALLLRFAGNGAFQQARGFGGPGEDNVSTLYVDGAGAVFASGRVDPAADLDPGAGLATLPGAAIYLSRFGSGLDFISARVLHDDRWRVDAQGDVFVTGEFAGAEDLDPSATVTKFTSAGGRDLYVVKLSADGDFDAAHPRTFHDANGDLVRLTLTGPGSARATLIGGAQHLADLAQLDLARTTLATTVTLSVTRFGSGDGASIVQKILTTETQQHLGTIALGSTVTLGDSIDDALDDLHVSGKLHRLTLGDVAANTIIRLGDGLPYNVEADTTTPDTYNHRPALTLGRVLGAGVEINVIGDGVTPQGPGGGGLGEVVIGAWEYDGIIRTTQSVGDFTVLNVAPLLDGTSRVVLQVDSNAGVHLGLGTTANIGTITITNGAWGSAGTEIEGAVEAFSAEAFLAAATLTAASVGPVTVDGLYSGTIILTDPDAPGVPTFTVNSNYTGVVNSAAAIKKLKIKGDFMGSLVAPAIGAITAYSFIGARDPAGFPTTYIKATTGGLGTLSTTVGPVTDFEIVTSLVFKGFKVSVSKLTADTIGIDNVHITAAAIGNISVSLKAASTATDIGLIGIRNSDFVTTANGTTRATAGTIGNVSVALAGAVGGDLAIGIQNSTFTALQGSFSAPTSTVNSLGNISVKITGQNGTNLGLDHVTFSGNTIGSTKVSVNRLAGENSLGKAVDTAAYTASGAIGAITIAGNATETQVSGLKVLAGTSMGGVTVKSADDLGGAHGTIENSAILAGQSLVLPGGTAAAQNAALALAKLGAINLSGSLLNSKLVAGGSLGTVTVGKNISGSHILAGATLGGDFALDGDETYQRVAKIAAVAVRGSLSATSLAAGVTPGPDFIFGNGDDALAPAVALVEGSSAIGVVSVGAGTLHASPGTTHFHAIEAAALAGIKVGAVSHTIFPRSLDPGTGGDDPSDIVVRLVSSAS